MSALLAIDPGTAILGWAYFESRELQCCGISNASKHKTLSDRIKCHRDNLSMWLGDVDVACERMFYRHAAGGKVKRKDGSVGKIDPQDLIDVNLVAGALGTQWVFPHIWKGSVPKAIHQRRIRSKLLDSEIRVLDKCEVAESYLHNTVDAVGIGLWALGRLKGKS